MGATGATGTQGPSGDAGTPGAPGDAGQDGLSSWFTAEGVGIEVTRLEVTATAATVEFTLDDHPGDGGTPLDRAGRLTQQPVTVSFVLAQRGAPDGVVPGPWTAYTTRSVSGGVQAALESVEGGFEVVDVRRGAYRYTFSTAPGGYDPGRTQGVLAVAQRGAFYDRSLGAAESDGGVPLARTVVEASRCASCHGDLAAHGGRFDSVEQCEVCHTGQSLEPVSGNTLDFRLMIHKLHRGSSLPSVVAGGAYRLADALGSLQDYSTVKFPQSIARCAACHGGAHGDRWQTQPSVEVCTSCHDDVTFLDPTPSGLVRHNYGVTPTSNCRVCHEATTGVSPIVTRHVDPSFDTSHSVELFIRPMATVPPGSVPSFDFEVKVDGAPRDLLASPLSLLRAVVAGPNGDFGRVWGTTSPFLTVTLQGTGAVGSLTAVDAANGVFRYVFPASAALPATAAGSFTVALEGRLYASLPNFPASSPLRAFAVTDAVPRARRSVIDDARCNACHLEKRNHSVGTRATNCVLCHSASNANDERIARRESTTVLAESLDFRVMIHKIHRGAALSQPYVLWGFPAPSVVNPAGTPSDFGSTRYPRPLTRCDACHLPGTWRPPTSEGRAPSVLEVLTCTEDPAADANDYCTAPYWNVSQALQLPPETAACTSCHDQPWVRVHAELNTNASGQEACTTCHGPGRAFDVDLVHQP